MQDLDKVKEEFTETDLNELNSALEDFDLSQGIIYKVYLKNATEEELITIFNNPNEAKEFADSERAENEEISDYKVVVKMTLSDEENTGIDTLFCQTIYEI